MQTMMKAWQTDALKRGRTWDIGKSSYIFMIRIPHPMLSFCLKYVCFNNCFKAIIKGNNRQSRKITSRKITLDCPSVPPGSRYDSWAGSAGLRPGETRGEHSPVAIPSCRHTSDPIEQLRWQFNKASMSSRSKPGCLRLRQAVREDLSHRDAQLQNLIHAEMNEFANDHLAALIID